MDETLYPSITSPGILHDAANMLTELIWLNKSIHTSEYPWRNKQNSRQWGKMVSCIKKIMRDFDIDSDQLGYYIFHCRPTSINGVEFAKMAVVAKKLLRRHDLDDLVRIYDERRDALKTSGMDHIKHKTHKPKSLKEFLEELENGKA